MSKSKPNLGEELAIAFLERHGFRVERFSKKELRSGKTPDFRVYKGDELVFYCEAKHIQEDRWLDEQLKEAKAGEYVGGSRPDPIFNRLTNHIHHAFQQFVAVNPNHEIPNVLILTNSDKQSNFGDLQAVLEGRIGQGDKIYEEYSEGRIREEKLKIDLYIWFDESKGTDQNGSRYFWADSIFYQRLCELMKSNSKEHRKN